MLTLIYKKNITEDLAIFRFQPSDGSEIAEFKPGQFVTLGQKSDDDDKVIYRPHSISSPPSEKKYYEFYIRWKEHPTFGKFTTYLFNMDIGNGVFWRKPAGKFSIEEFFPNGIHDKRQMILVATGTSLAPFMSYVLHLKDTGTKKRIILLHGVKYKTELGYRDTLEELATENNDSWNFDYFPMISRPSNPLNKKWNGFTGRVQKLLEGLENHQSRLEKVLNEKILLKIQCFTYVATKP